ncbi:hypothetical protein BHE74_00023650 [Ensete ventricosum]|nr:hypothetical protein BHE74_00023650 [Ensete ventricosum]
MGILRPLSSLVFGVRRQAAESCRKKIQSNSRFLAPWYWKTAHGFARVAKSTGFETPMPGGGFRRMNVVCSKAHLGSVLLEPESAEDSCIKATSGCGVSDSPIDSAPVPDDVVCGVLVVAAPSLPYLRQGDHVYTKSDVLTPGRSYQCLVAHVAPGRPYLR